MSTDISPSFKRKDPSAILVYDVDWDTHWLAPAVTIITSTWSIAGITTATAWSGVTAYVAGDKVLSVGVIYVCILAHTNQLPPNVTYWTVSDATPLTKDQESLVAGNRKTRVRLSAGTPGTKYQVVNRIITSETPSQQDERTFELLVEDR